jgi:hypothetical protein
MFLFLMLIKFTGVRNQESNKANIVNDSYSF